MIQVLKPLFGKLTSFAQNRMGFKHPPRLFLKNDLENAKLHLGKTAHYDPNKKAITIFTTGRHPKDILRSFAHELVHHAQNVRGDLTPEKLGDMGDKYAQENPHMRKMEEEAYLVGNMCFRDWEDSEKFNLQESTLLKENKTMTNKVTKESLENMIRSILIEKEVSRNLGSPLSGIPRFDAAQSAKKAMAADKKRKAAKSRPVKDPGAKYDDDLFDAPSSEDDEIAGVNENEDLEEGGCQSGPHKRDEEDLEEKKLPPKKPGEDCCGAKDCGHKGDLEEELKNPDKADLDDDGKLSGYEKKRAKAIEKSMEDQKESKIQTPEQENSLYESRFAKRNANLFEDLVKKWAK